MAITILPEEQLQHRSENSVMRKIPLLFFPAPAELYTRRYHRLQKLAETSPFSEYLQFCASVVHTQSTLLTQMPIKEAFSTVSQSVSTPLSLDHYPLTRIWQNYLHQILVEVPSETPQIQSVVVNLQRASADQLQEKAMQLLKTHFDQVDSNESLFIWAALSLYYTQLASQIKGNAFSETSSNHWLCPVCNSLPTASIIHIGANVGLRYLHCSLCESEWYIPRVKCTSCDNLQHVHYFSLDEERAAIQTECCDNCQSYLKMVNQDMDPNVDIIADDLASLMLDVKTEEEGFAKSGLNPFLFTQHSSE